MTESVRVGVIGAGYWGKKVIREYLRLAREEPELELSKACDVREDNLSYLDEAYQIPRRCLVKDYREFLKSEHVDAVHICTPNETHYQICRDALEADKHVLLEKPMTLKAYQAYDLVNIAERRGLCLQVGHIFRFATVLEKVRRLIKNNFFGEIYYLKLRWTTLMSPPPERDIIFDLGPHPIDIANFLLDLWPSKVACKARSYTRKGLDEIAYLTTEFDGKMMGHIELSWLQPGKTRQLSIIASERCATIDCLNQTIQVHENGNGEAYNANMERNNTILAEINHFVQSVLGKEKSNNPGSVGARCVEVLELARSSLRLEKTMRVPSRKWKHRALIAGI